MESLFGKHAHNHTKLIYYSENHKLPWKTPRFNHQPTEPSRNRIIHNLKRRCFVMIFIQTYPNIQRDVPREAVYYHYVHLGATQASHPQTEDMYVSTLTKVLCLQNAFTGILLVMKPISVAFRWGSVHF